MLLRCHNAATTSLQTTDHVMPPAHAITSLTHPMRKVVFVDFFRHGLKYRPLNATPAQKFSTDRGLLLNKFAHDFVHHRWEHYATYRIGPMQLLQIILGDTRPCHGCR